MKNESVKGGKTRGSRTKAGIEASKPVKKSKANDSRGTRQKKAPRAREADYRELFDHMTEGFALHEIICDDSGKPVDYRFLDVNPAFESMTGLKREQVLGRRVLEVLPDLEPAWIERYGQVALTGEPCSFTSYSAPLNRWFEVRSYRPAERQFAVIFMDISSHKKADLAIRESEARLKQAYNLLDSITNGTELIVAAIDADFRYLFFNEAYKEEIRRLFGKEIEVGSSMAETFAHMPEQQEIALMQWGRTLKGESANFRIEFGDPGRYRKIYSVRHTPIFNAEGTVVGAGEVAFDISEQARAEEWLQRVALRNEILSATSVRLLETEAPQTVVNELCSKVMKYLDCQAFFNFLADDKAGKLRLNACAGIPEDEARRIEWLDYGVAVCGCAARDAQRIIAEDILNTPDPRTDLVRSYGIQAYCCHPLMVQGRVIGTLSFGTRTRAAFSEDDISLMRTVADQVALAMQRLEARQQLHWAKEEWERTFDSVQDPIAVLDGDHRVRRVNRAMAERIGVPPEECIGKQCFSVVHGTACPPGFCPHAQTMADGEPHTAEVHEERIGGYFTVSTTPLMDENGNRIGSVHVAHDITELKRAEAVLKRSHDELEEMVRERAAQLVVTNQQLAAEIVERRKAEEAVTVERLRLTEVLDMLPAYVILLTPDYHVPFANRFFEERFGKSGGKRCYEYLFQRSEPCENCETYKVLDTNAPHRWEWTGPDGRNYDIYDFPFKEADGATHILEVGIDITEQRAAEREKDQLWQQLVQSQKMEAIGMLAGGVAHDFNNLLTPIIGYAEMGMRKLLREDPLRVSLGKIHEAGSRAKELTKQLLAFGRKQTLELKVVRPDAIIADFSAMLRRLIRENIRIEYRSDADTGYIRADATQIQQIVINLAVNANDAMPDGGVLQIGAANVALDAEYCAFHPDAKPGRYVMLTVSDTGHGMDGETLRRIYEPFFTTKKAGEGTGLGLATVYGIVKQHEGSIFTYSEPGKGTTFKVYLPRVDAAPEAGGAEKPKRNLRGNETVLVVEDEASVGELVKGMLEDQGYRILLSGTTSDALLFASEYDGPIDLLLTDVVMPAMNGRELYQRIAALHPEIKVLFMSGYTHDIIAHHNVIDEGINFIQKPFTMEALTGKVREALEK